MNRSYRELVRINDYQERFNYLRLDGAVGEDTFGYERYLNQILYQSSEWRRFRREIILRDDGHDMAHQDYEINGIIIVHHLNPLTIDDVDQMTSRIFDPDNVVCVSRLTHNALHYGDDSLLIKGPVERRPFDTCPWRE